MMGERVNADLGWGGGGAGVGRGWGKGGTGFVRRP